MISVEVRSSTTREVKARATWPHEFLPMFNAWEMFRRVDEMMAPFRRDGVAIIIRREQ